MKIIHYYSKLFTGVLSHLALIPVAGGVDHDDPFAQRFFLLLERLNLGVERLRRFPAERGSLDSLPFAQLYLYVF